jgi:hypothetical protein
MELNPQIVFEKLFGDGGSAEERATRREQDHSILDSVTKGLVRFKRDLGTADRAFPLRCWPRPQFLLSRHPRP